MLYQPPHFKVSDRGVALELMRRHPLASLITVAAGEPAVSHVPLAVREEAERLVLLGHVARGNPQWQLWRDGDPVLALFHGPDAYVSPLAYEVREAVPTWNYAVVHAAGPITVRHDSDAKEGVLKALIRTHDVPYLDRWDELALDWREKMKQGIVAFDIVVERLDAKFKLSQNRNSADRAGVLNALQAGSERAHDVAQWMQRLAPRE
jgi:transcriptional regulator